MPFADMIAEIFEVTEVTDSTEFLPPDSLLDARSPDREPLELNRNVAGDTLIDDAVMQWRMGLNLSNLVLFLMQRKMNKCYICDNDGMVEAQ